MIDSVRNTVLSIISKDNRGYITPEEFNYFAKQAQLEIFEDMFFRYSNMIFKQNQRQHGSGYTDTAKVLEEMIDKFSTYSVLNYNNVTLKFDIPADNYSMDKILYNDTVEIERVLQGKINNLLQSTITAPSVYYPVYTIDGEGIQVYPVTINGFAASVTAQYIRYPRDPKWTYNPVLVNGTPMFDPGQTDYQDFELPLSFETDLVIKVLQYSGISIRENEVTQAAKAEEMQNSQLKV